MSLHGTLETFALPDVMALLAATKKTGELRVVGGKLDGRVHLDAGRVIAANVGRADSFVDAVFELLRLTSGKFSFDADKQPDDATDAADPVDVEPLLLEAQSRLEAWREIEAVVPSMDHGVVLVTDLSDPHVTLASDQWRMVVAVAGAACVHEVADHLGLGEYAVCKALKDLVESGVVAVSDPPAPKKVEAKAEVKVEAKLEKIEPEAKAEPAPEPEKAEKVEKAAKDDKAEAQAKAEKAAKDDKAEATSVIEPELKPKPLPETPVEVPALSKADTMSPAAPGEEPEEAKPAPKKVATTTSGTGGANGKPAVDPSQAKQLVSQLAAMSAAGDKPAANEKDKTDKPEAKAEAAPDAAVEAASDGTEGGDSEEPLNRGLLLKFLSSVRQ